MAAPEATDPLPAGSPVPLGATVMSSLRTSSGVSARPRPGVCACSAAARQRSNADLNINILHRPIGLDAPALNAVEVVELPGSVLRQPSRPSGLDFPGFV